MPVEATTTTATRRSRALPAVGGLLGLLAYFAALIGVVYFDLGRVGWGFGTGSGGEWGGLFLYLPAILAIVLPFGGFVFALGVATVVHRWSSRAPLTLPERLPGDFVVVGAAGFAGCLLGLAFILDASSLSAVAALETLLAFALIAAMAALAWLIALARRRGKA